jgi:hypothetical protein
MFVKKRPPAYRSTHETLSFRVMLRLTRGVNAQRFAPTFTGEVRLYEPSGALIVR